MALTQTTETLKSWLEITDAEIAELRGQDCATDAEQIKARLDHALKVRGIVAGELETRAA